MIRFEQRNLDVQATERVFKKIVNPSQNAIRLVDKDGVPLRTPNTNALSRLHSTYVASPRGVPTRKSNHSYSGQLAQAKMQNLVNSLETNLTSMATQPEMISYSSMHNVGNGLSSAGSSRHYIPTNLTSKRRTFGSGPPYSSADKSLPAKSASTQRSRFLTSAAATDHTLEDLDTEKSNDSEQGQRIEKEWSALSQCRALKRSSEIVSHRVDRMYFMTGNKLKIKSKYHIEDDELKQLREMSAARASSRASRSSRSRKGDLYRPDRSDLSSKTMDSFLTEGTNGDLSGTENFRPSRQGKQNGVKRGSDPKILVSQKVLTSKPAGRKSPIQGWDGAETSDKGSVVENEVISKEVLHDGNADVINVEVKKTAGDLSITEAEKTDNTIVENDKDNNDKAGANAKPEQSEAPVEANRVEQVENVESENITFVTEGKVEDENETKGEDDVDKVESEEVVTVEEDSVHNAADNRSVTSDNDKTVVKSEDYIEQAQVEEKENQE